ncbi:MAG: HU family DNA-binding protein [Clostridia bacterium]|nr:HU family DNA-binding protein [Clostridia bacterium]
MNKAELIAMIAEKSGLTKKDAEMSLNAFIDVVTEELQDGGKIQLIGFGTFEVHDRKERMGHDPRTGNPIKIPASKSPVFKAGKALKDAVNSK